jgi:hypothetical protein
MHSLSLCAIMGELLIFVHNLETGFLSQILAIIGSTLSIMVNWKKEDYTSSSWKFVIQGYHMASKTMDVYTSWEDYELLSNQVLC